MIPGANVLSGLMVAWLLAGSGTIAAQVTTPYAGQEQRAIKALAPEEVDGYLAGRGLGLAKAAELKGYPGPMHVLELELADRLQLSSQQRVATLVIFARMQVKARELGERLVTEELALDRAFRDRTINANELTQRLAAIGKLHAEVRGAHLEAHLAQTDVLSPLQVQRYASLRGYGEGGHPHVHKH